jgi:hypothetical protein
MGFFRKDRRRRLAFESLECRRALAGNVLASVSASSGSLQITGDDASNAVEIHGTGIPGEVLVTPIEGQTGQPTTVNGGSTPILLTGVTGGLGVGMRQGNDEFYIKDFAFSGNGFISGDGGADKIQIGQYVAYGQLGSGDVSFGGWVRVDEQLETSAADSDQIFVGRVVVGEYLEITPYHGNDSITLYNVQVLAQNVGIFDALRLFGNDGHDVVNLAYATVYGGAMLQPDTLVGGNDLVSVITSVFHGRTYVDVWHGTNTVALNANQFLNTLEIFTEIGSDTVILTNSFCVKKVTMASFFATSNGNDSFLVQGNTISERIYLSSGSGNDTVTVQANQIVTAGIFCGAGSDALTVRNNVYYGHADFVGGTEFDVLYLSGNLFHSTYAYYEFESIQP